MIVRGVKTDKIVAGPTLADVLDKSPVIKELLKLGYNARDADNWLCNWYDETGRIVNYPHNKNVDLKNWETKNTFKFSESLTSKFANDSAGKLVFICGNAPANDLVMAKKYFNKVICLTIDEDTMAHRILTRPTLYGKDPEVLEKLRKEFQPGLSVYKKYGAVMIDSDRYLKVVVEDVLRVAQQ